MSRLANAIGLPDANEKVLRLARVLMFLGPLANFTFVMSTTFYLIFVAEALGGGDYILGLPLVATLVVIQMGIQLVLDYPTGAIGDWIGQRYIMASATLCYAVAFWLVAMVTTLTPFWFLIAIYAIQGLGNSQIVLGQSGRSHAGRVNSSADSWQHPGSCLRTAMGISAASYSSSGAYGARSEIHQRLP
jgi:MFS family permease